MAWKQLFLNWLSIAVGIVIAAHTSSGISYGGDYAILFVVVILLSALNLLLKPILVLFTLPFIVLSLGLGLWILNAFLFLMMGTLVNGFYVEGFLPALWGALWVSLANFVVRGSFVGRRPTPIHYERGVNQTSQANPNTNTNTDPRLTGDKNRQPSKNSQEKEDVIDI